MSTNIILHCFFEFTYEEPIFGVWGELDGELDESFPLISEKGPKNKKKSKKQRITVVEKHPDHPFSLSQNQINLVCKHVLRKSYENHTQAVIRGFKLPTYFDKESSIPVASPQIEKLRILNIKENQKVSQLEKNHIDWSSWNIPVIEFDTEGIIAFLKELQRINESPFNGINFIEGKSIDFVRNVLEFTKQPLIDLRIIPTTRVVRRGYSNVNKIEWSPIFSDTEYALYCTFLQQFPQEIVAIIAQNVISYSGPGPNSSNSQLYQTDVEKIDFHLKSMIRSFTHFFIRKTIIKKQSEIQKNFQISQYNPNIILQSFTKQKARNILSERFYLDEISKGSSILEESRYLS